MACKTSQNFLVRVLAQSTSPEEMVNFLNGSVIESVEYDKNTDKLTITFYNEAQDLSIETTTNKISDILRTSNWQPVKSAKKYQVASSRKPRSYLERVSLACRRLSA